MNRLDQCRGKVNRALSHHQGIPDFPRLCRRRCALLSASIFCSLGDLRGIVPRGAEALEEPFLNSSSTVTEEDYQKETTANSSTASGIIFSDVLQVPSGQSNLNHHRDGCPWSPVCCVL